MYITSAITALVTIFDIVLQDLFTVNKDKNRKGRRIYSLHHPMERLQDVKLKNNKKSMNKSYHKY
jgi:hypothetical protein